MLRKYSLVVAMLSGIICTSRASEFADSVIAYDPGSGYAQKFTNPFAALGEPSRINPFGEPTDPFDPPYGTNQITSIGEGGSLTVAFQTPILNHPNNLFGLDFIIFGNSGFVITNDFDLNTFTWIGTPATDGSLFAENEGVTRVSVSRDGLNFFELRPPAGITVDKLFPTDGAGDFHVPIAPQITQAEFSGATLPDIRTLYHGSGGGTAFDISWAVDVRGRPVFLPEIRFIRVDVLSGKSEIDAFAAVNRAGKAAQRGFSR
ncbi:MAG TPA: hypothetical protein VGE41_08560 [Verrucomicrobiae bacterium]